MTVMTSRRRALRTGAFAFTLMETLIAATLTLVFAGVVGTAVVSTTSSASETVARIQAENQSRRALDVLSRTLRGARPLGVCQDGPTIPLGSCRSVSELQDAFEQATPTTLVFYSYASDAVAQTSGLTAPDRVIVSTDAAKLMTVGVYNPVAGATYTTPSWPPASSAPQTRLTVGTLASATVFRFYDANGDEIVGSGNDGALDQTQRRRIALITTSPTISWEGGGTSGTLQPRVVTALASKVFGL